jgi:hypothetical protein
MMLVEKSFDVAITATQSYEEMDETHPSIEPNQDLIR